jgi:glycine/sarcosine N-methyltransferase
MAFPMESPRTEPAALYDDLAEHYHLIFEDWEQSIARQAAALGPIIESAAGPGPLSILDCACGIGTQAIGLAQRGHAVTASDASAGAVARARREAAKRELRIDFLVADMRELAGIADGAFDAVIAADNALPHLLKQAELVRALERIGSKLRRGGVFLATVRDYDQLLESRPVCQPPQFYSHEGLRRFVHQVWDWEGDQYTFHLYLTLETETGWAVHHYASRYRALRRAELTAALEDAGFGEIRWLEPAETSFFQPMVIARKPC